MKSGSATGSADAAAGVEASVMKRKWEITGAKKLAQLGTEPTHKREASNRFVKEVGPVSRTYQNKIETNRTPSLSLTHF